MRIAATRPPIDTIMITMIASPNVWAIGSMVVTRTDPTTAVPKEEPRLEALLDRPEISPWSFSGNADWTTFTEEVSMVPMPSPIMKRPGTKYQTFATDALPEIIGSKITRAIPTVVRMKPMMMSRLCVVLVAIFLALVPVSRMPMVAGVTISPAEAALNPRTVWKKTEMV